MINRVSIAVAFVVGIFMVAQYFIDSYTTDVLYGMMLDYYQIIFAVTMLVGGISLVRFHSNKIRRDAESRFYSVATIVSVVFMVVSAAIFGTGVTSPYQWAFINLQAPMQATTFALLAFFVASAAYRGFRVRSKPAFVLALAAVIVLVGRSAFGDMISEKLPELAGWVLNHPSAAAKRGVLVGIGLGSVATALRVILGIERSYL
jgi:hypothetical protein